MYYIELDRAGFYFGISNFDEFIRSDDIVECNTLPNVEGTYDIHSYRFVNGLWVFDAGRQAKINKLQIERARDEKIEELTQESKRTISKGINVELSDGKHHFSLEDKDIIGIEMMYKDALDNFELLVWHADGEECKNYSKEDAIKIGIAAKKFRTYHETLLNHLIENIKIVNDIPDLKRFKYTPDCLGYIYHDNFLKITSSL